MEALIKIDRRYIMLLVLILIIIPAVHPLGIPLTVSSYTKEAYDYIQNLPSGSTVVIAAAVDVALWPELESYTRALIWHLAKRPVKFVIVNFSPDSVLLMQSAMNYVDIPKNFPDKKYGVCFVMMGYLAGVESAYAKFASDPQKAFDVDYYGTPVSQLPAYQGLKQTSDISLVIHITGSADAAIPVRQFVTTFKLPLLIAPVLGGVPSYMPFYQAGNFVGLITGIRGGAEYELLTERPATGLAITDALSISFLYTIFLIVLGNVCYFTMRGKEKKVN